MRFEDLKAATLEQIGSPAANAKARELAKAGQVQACYQLPDRLLGLVVDEGPCPVEVRLREGEASFICSCPEAEGGICLHALALLWAWVEDAGKFLNKAELTERLKKYSKKDLLDIILDLAERVPEARGVLREEEQGLDEILESIDLVIEDVAEDQIEAQEAEARIRRAQAQADRMAQSGRLAEARSVYFYLLDNLLGLEERLKKPSLFSQELKGEIFEEYCQFIHEDRQLERELVQQELEQLESRAAVSQGEFNLAEVKQELLGAA